MTRTKIPRGSPAPANPAGKAGVAMQRKPAAGGLPENLMGGIEALSGQSMADVKVQFNSPEPDRYGAHAFARGTSIHVAPGQEQHLPHEAWHVAQQKQGRVPATGKMGGMPVNTDQGLEREADTMGAKAMQMAAKGMSLGPLQFIQGPGRLPVVTQLKPTHVKFTEQDIKFFDAHAAQQTVSVGHETVAELLPSDPLKGSAPGASKEHDVLMKQLALEYPNSGFLRGHLLNDNLGGPGIWENMFPITNKANGSHLYDVEKPVKQSLLEAHELNEIKGNKDRFYVRYAVEATPTKASDFTDNPRSTLKCNWSVEPWKDVPDKKDFLRGEDVIITSDEGVEKGQNKALAKHDWSRDGSGRTKAVRDNFKAGVYETVDSSVAGKKKGKAGAIEAADARTRIIAAIEKQNDAKKATETLVSALSKKQKAYKSASDADEGLHEAGKWLDGAKDDIENSQKNIK